MDLPCLSLPDPCLSFTKMHSYYRRQVHGVWYHLCVVVDFAENICKHFSYIKEQKYYRKSKSCWKHYKTSIFSYKTSDIKKTFDFKTLNLCFHLMKRLLGGHQQPWSTLQSWDATRAARCPLSSPGDSSEWRTWLGSTRCSLSIFVLMLSLGHLKPFSSSSFIEKGIRIKYTHIMKTKMKESVGF